jgi:hypothetical protein
MGTNSLERKVMDQKDEDIWEEFFKDNQGVVFLVVRPDKTVSLKTNIYDMKELKAVFSTAYTMATFQDVKSDDYGVDRMH